MRAVEKRGPILLLLLQVLATVLEDIPTALLLPPGEFQRLDEALVNALLPELPALLPELPPLLPELQRLVPEFPEVPPSLWKSLNRLGKRSQPAMVQDVVRRLCALRPFRLEEVARLLRRTPDGVRNNYIAPMLRSGVMERTAEATPTHPGQAYRAVAGSTEVLRAHFRAHSARFPPTSRRGNGQ